jgi:sigma-B regulation protein RsbU (phosphoserine phosphatase)
LRAARLTSGANVKAPEHSIALARTAPVAPEKILLVESEPDQAIYWSAVLSSLGFDVLTATTLHEAHALLSSELRIIACSSLLADGRGIDFFSQMRLRKECALAYLILLTSSFGKDEVIESLHSGANDCMDKGASYGEVRARFELATRVLSLNEALHQKSLELGNAMTVIQTELDSAARLQAAILPKALDYRGIQIRTLYRPSETLGGDMLGVNVVDEDRIAIGLIDIAGHGTAAALISCSLIREMMDRMTQLLQDRPSETSESCGQLVIDEMNRRYCRMDIPGFYFTALAGVLDTRRRTFSYCQAGHPSLLSFDPTQGWHVLEDTGFPVGLFEEAQYVHRHIEMPPGRVLLAISDGLLRPTATDPGGVLELLEFLQSTAASTLSIMERLNWIAAQAQGVERDDQSAMLINSLGVGIAN